MCLIAFAWMPGSRRPLALIANRDEFHARPTAAARFDPADAGVYGGRDLQAGGSWLLASARDRMAAVTNVRDGPQSEATPRSRGALVHDFAHGRQPAAAYAATLAATAGEYGRYNLLLWDGDALVFASNHPAFATHALTPGLHAMSNGALDARWPKSMHATAALSSWLASAASAGRIDAAALSPLFQALGDTTQATDALLPDTGVGLALERTLSPAFVLGERYGTRCSTVVLVEPDRIVFAERRFGAHGVAVGDSLQDVARKR